MMLLFFIVSICIGTAYGLIEPIPLPSSLEECINYKVDLNKGSGIPLHVIQNLCLGKFIMAETPHNWARNLTTEEENYMRSLMRKIVSESEVSVQSHRSKREVPLFNKRYRREIRAGSYKHWEDFAKAVRRLKFKEIGPNGRSRYDTIADIHMTAITSAHSGPNFLSWHRLYSLVFETALGVPIPYWDSTIDYEMEDPTQSILFTEKYFGNGFGMVKTGPFANFQTPAGPLIRNIGSDGALFNKRDLYAIFTRTKLVQITEPTAEERVSFEGQHNSVHNWVDGQMNTQEFSPHDPLFWNHHAFVDYIWEEFRKLQLSRGVDPVTDIPTAPENVTFQNGNDPSVGLYGFYNRDGYTERIANMVKYEPHPQCPKCGGGQDLTCDIRRGVCISKSRKPTEYSGDRVDAQEIADRMIEATTGRKRGVFEKYMRDNRVRGDSLTIRKEKEFSDYTLTIGKGIPVIKSYQEITVPLNKQMAQEKSILKKEVPQINLEMHGGSPSYQRSSSYDFAYGPIQAQSIIFYPTDNYQRHTKSNYFEAPFSQFSGINFSPFTNYMTDFRTRGDSITMKKPVYYRKRRSLNTENHLQIWDPKLQNTFFLDGKTDLESWVLMPVKILYNNVTEFGSQQTNDLLQINSQLQTSLGEITTTCSYKQNPLKIYVQSHGLDYFGKYKDFSVYKQADTDINFIGIKKPTDKAVETYISAYDSCGNVCSTRCLVPGINPSVYKSCTGAVRASNKFPLMYKHIQNNGAVNGSDNLVPIIFVCDV